MSNYVYHEQQLVEQCQYNTITSRTGLPTNVPLHLKRKKTACMVEQYQYDTITSKTGLLTNVQL